MIRSAYPVLFALTCIAAAPAAAQNADAARARMAGYKQLGAAFKAAQDAFAREAPALTQVSAGNDIAAIRVQARKLGGACKSCHDRFHEEVE